jgi:hypothetical protein
MLRATVQGPNHLEIFRRISQNQLLDGAPSIFEIDDVKRSATDWPELAQAANGQCLAFWEDERYRTIKGFSYLPGPELVHFTLPIPGTFTQHLSFIETLPLQLAVVESPLDSEWRGRTWGFGRGMGSHGLAAIFRGAGHDRLVSHRWLDFGPWRVIHRPNDTTVVQFHDDSLTDGAEAYTQAAPGHERMGNSDIGGYLQHQLDWICGNVRGLYTEKSKLFEIVVPPGVAVPQSDMLGACALKLKRKLENSRDRIDTIAYVFIDRADAEAHLHELWLRELQCWYVDERGKHRLDDTYHPTPNPPDWVKRLNDRDAGK